MKSNRGATSRVVAVVVLSVGCFLAVAMLPGWLRVYYHESVPRWLEREALDIFLQTSRVVYLFLLPATPIVTAIATARLVRARRSGRAAPWSARTLVSCVTLLALLPICEVCANWCLDGRVALPMPTTLEDDSANAIDLVVVGESTALGWPYQPSFSAAQVMAWQLERVFPERAVHVDMQAAEPGFCLENSIQRLKRIGYRPDVMLVCSGHNEFQARFGWPRVVRHYADSKPGSAALIEHVRAVSAILRLLDRAIDLNQVDALPSVALKRELIDVPCCTPAEYARVLGNYHSRLDELAEYCEQAGTVLVVVLPPCNLGGFPPNRSYLAAETVPAERQAFARAFLAAAELEQADPASAEAEFRRLVAEQPLFAEAHFRLARQFERRGSFDEAESHYRLARDFDGMPLRCPGDFLDAARDVCRRHPNAVLVDGPEVFRRLSPQGIANDHLMHDAQHPTLQGHLALAEDALVQLAARRALGWPASIEAPKIDAAECVEHFGINSGNWQRACVYTAQFFEAIAGLRYDPELLVRRSEEYHKAAQRIAEGESPDEVGITGLGIDAERSPSARLERTP